MLLKEIEHLLTVITFSIFCKTKSTCISNPTYKSSSEIVSEGYNAVLLLGIVKNACIGEKEIVWWRSSRNLGDAAV